MACKQIHSANNMIIPLIPNVGPCDGCRMQVKQFFLRCAPIACETPTVVVLLPSPNGVGVILVTRTNICRLEYIDKEVICIVHQFTRG